MFVNDRIPATWQAESWIRHKVIHKRPFHDNAHFNLLLCSFLITAVPHFRSYVFLGRFSTPLVRWASPLVCHTVTRRETRFAASYLTGLPLVVVVAVGIQCCLALHKMSSSSHDDESGALCKWDRPDLPRKCTYKLGQSTAKDSPHRHVNRLTSRFVTRVI